jgi:hypothetical protein
MVVLSLALSFLQITYRLLIDAVTRSSHRKEASVPFRGPLGEESTETSSFTLPSFSTLFDFHAPTYHLVVSSKKIMLAIILVH